MKPNATPFYDQSDNTTGCCALFNPEGWDGQELHFRNKPFLRATTRSLAHIPMNIGRVFARVQDHLTRADAVDPDHFLVLSRELSASQGEHLFAVTREVPDEEMISLSGNFLTKVFHGPFADQPHWASQLRAIAEDHGEAPGEVWFFYTTCPKCAKAYGQNPVVGLVELRNA